MLPRERIVATYVFLSIVFLTAVAAVAANLGLFGLDPTSAFAKWSLTAVLAEVVGAVVLVWKTGATQVVDMSAAIRFPTEVKAEGLEFNLAACSYEVRNMRAEVKATGRLNLVFGNGGWECRLPAPHDADESISLTLQEKSGQVWEVRPFYPLSRDVTVVPRSSKPPGME